MTITVLSGLPGAGKTTLAGELVGRTKAVLISRDRLREMLAPLDDERVLTLVMRGIARPILGARLNAVIDSCNLTLFDRVLWSDLAIDCGARLDWRHLDTPVEECVRRDATRPHPVGEGLIKAMAAAAYAGEEVRLAK